MSGGELRVGVVGLGAFGRHHVRHYAASARAHLVGVCDRDGAAVARAVDTYGCDGFSDPADLIGRVDAVSVAVPAIHHADVAGPLLDAGIHVLVEKPLAPDPGTARRLARAASVSGVVLQVGHIERYSPAIAWLMDTVTVPRRIASVRKSPWTGRSTDVDVVLDMMIHDIDHVLRLAGAPLDSITANSRAVKGAHADEAEAWLTFANGTIATISSSRVADTSERTLTVTEGALQYRVDLGATTVTIVDRLSGERSGPLFPPNDNLGDQIAAFIASICDDAPVIVDAAAGIAAVEVAARIRVAAEETAHVSELT